MQAVEIAAEDILLCDVRSACNASYSTYCQDSSLAPMEVAYAFGSPVTTSPANSLRHRVIPSGRIDELVEAVGDHKVRYANTTFFRSEVVLRPDSEDVHGASARHGVSKCDIEMVTR
jgi:hypothetical protein